MPASTITYEREEFCRYLSGTLIPDLIEDGRECTAQDFDLCVLYIRAGAVDSNVRAHAYFLSKTLIPELMDSGRTCTADDFRLAVEFMMNPGANVLTLILR